MSIQTKGDHNFHDTGEASKRQQLFGMSNFTKDANGWCEYFTVVQPEPGRPCGRDAFGLAGPFAQQEEAEQARDLIAPHRDGKIGVMRCAFDADNGDLFENLAELQESARRFIAELRG